MEIIFIQLLRMLYIDHGLTVDVILHQSVLSIGSEGVYGVTNRVADSIHFANWLRAKLVSLGVPVPDHGLIDASAAKGWTSSESRQTAWVDGLRNQGHVVTTVLHDFPAAYVLGQIGTPVRNPSHLANAMYHTKYNLGTDSIWWVSSGSAAYAPSTARQKMLNASTNYFNHPLATTVTDGFNFGDFHFNFAADDPDTVNGAPYTALEVFNELYDHHE